MFPLSSLRISDCFSERFHKPLSRNTAVHQGFSYLLSLFINLQVQSYHESQEFTLLLGTTAMPTLLKPSYECSSWTTTIIQIPYFSSNLPHLHWEVKCFTQNLLYYFLRTSLINILNWNTDIHLCLLEQNTVA